MDVRQTLRSNLAAESKAYGYTLSIWGSGAILIHSYGAVAPANVLSFVGGAVLAFGVLAWIAFTAVFSRFAFDHEEDFVVASLIHILAAFGNVAISLAIVGWLHGPLSPWIVFGLIGFHASFSYNVLLLIEHNLYEHIMRWEQQLEEAGRG